MCLRSFPGSILPPQPQNPSLPLPPPSPPPPPHPAAAQPRNRAAFPVPPAPIWTLLAFRSCVRAGAELAGPRRADGGLAGLLRGRGAQRPLRCGGRTLPLRVGGLRGKGKGRARRGGAGAAAGGGDDCRHRGTPSGFQEARLRSAPHSPRAARGRPGSPNHPTGVSGCVPPPASVAQDWRRPLDSVLCYTVFIATVRLKIPKSPSS